MRVKPAQTTAVRRDVDALVRMRDAYGYELTNDALASQSFDVARESRRLAHKPDDVAVDEDNVAVAKRDLHAVERVAILDAQIERQTHQVSLLGVCGDVRHECEVLDETARFAFRCVRRTQHAPL